MMNENEALYALWMIAAASASPSAARRAAKYFASAKDVYESKRSDFGEKFTEEQKDLFMNKDLREAEKLMQKCEKLGMRVIPFSSPEMPEEARRLENPPCLLFVKGTGVFSPDDVRVAIVGARDATPLGRKIASRLAYELSSAGVTVISGMAAGIDTAAHKGALYEGKETFAFLGGGADVVYPKQNEELYMRITDNGAVVSEYLPGSSAQGFHFPERNRLLSAFAKAVIIVECSEKSGSMRTAEHAKKQGVPVLAVPGPVDSAVSAGTNLLIKNGCPAVTRADDVTDFLNFRYGTRLRIMKRLSSAAENVESERKPAKKKEADTVKEVLREKKTAAEEKRTERKDEDLSFHSEGEKNVYRLIEKAGTCSVDDVCQALSLDFGGAFSLLTKLEDEGLICEATAGRYALTE
jgi:DNA processing protein